MFDEIKADLARLIAEASNPKVKEEYEAALRNIHAAAGCVWQVEQIKEKLVRRETEFAFAKAKEMFEGGIRYFGGNKGTAQHNGTTRQISIQQTLSYMVSDGKGGSREKTLEEWPDQGIYYILNPTFGDETGGERYWLLKDRFAEDWKILEYLRDLTEEAFRTAKE